MPVHGTAVWWYGARGDDGSLGDLVGFMRVPYNTVYPLASFRLSLYDRDSPLLVATPNLRCAAVSWLWHVYSALVWCSCTLLCLELRPEMGRGSGPTFSWGNQNNGRSVATLVDSPGGLIGNAIGALGAVVASAIGALVLWRKLRADMKTSTDTASATTVSGVLSAQMAYAQLLLGERTALVKEVSELRIEVDAGRNRLRNCEERLDECESLCRTKDERIRVLERRTGIDSDYDRGMG